MFSRRPKGATMHNQGNSGFASLLWMLFGAIVTLGVGVFMYKSGVFDLGVHNQPQETQKQIQTKVDLDKDNDDPDYEFYEVLHNQKSKTIPNTVVPDKPVDEDIQKQAARLKPDVVIVGTQEELDVTDPSNPPKNNTAEQPEQFQPAVNAEESTKTSESYAQITAGKTVKPSTVDDIKTLSIQENTTKETVSDDAHHSTPIMQSASDSDKANKPSKSYILQINSFDSADEADRRRAQVLMAGIDDAYVVKKIINEQTVYQVVSNAMSSKESVIQNQQRLKNSGIDSLIIEQRVK